MTDGNLSSVYRASHLIVSRDKLRYARDPFEEQVDKYNLALMASGIKSAGSGCSGITVGELCAWSQMDPLGPTKVQRPRSGRSDPEPHSVFPA